MIVCSKVSVQSHNIINLLFSESDHSFFPRETEHNAVCIIGKKCGNMEFHLFARHYFTASLVFPPLFKFPPCLFGKLVQSIGKSSLFFFVTMGQTKMPSQVLQRKNRMKSIRRGNYFCSIGKRSLQFRGIKLHITITPVVS